MRIEDQVVSLELAKRLKELEVKQESVFFWGINREGVVNLWKTWASGKDRVSAFTVAELGEMLRGNFVYPSEDGKFKKDSDVYFCCVVDYWITPHYFSVVLRETYDDHRELEREQAKTEADARAKMLIHLIEKGIVKP